MRNIVLAILATTLTIGCDNNAALKKENDELKAKIAALEQESNWAQRLVQVREDEISEELAPLQRQLAEELAPQCAGDEECEEAVRSFDSAEHAPYVAFDKVLFQWPPLGQMRDRIKARDGAAKVLASPLWPRAMVLHRQLKMLVGGG